LEALEAYEEYRREKIAAKEKQIFLTSGLAGVEAKRKSEAEDIARM